MFFFHHENKVKPSCQSSVRVGWSCQLDLGCVGFWQKMSSDLTCEVLAIESLFSGFRSLKIHWKWPPNRQNLVFALINFNCKPVVFYYFTYTFIVCHWLAMFLATLGLLVMDKMTIFNIVVILATNMPNCFPDSQPIQNPTFGFYAPPLSTHHSVGKGWKCRNMRKI